MNGYVDLRALQNCLCPTNRYNSSLSALVEDHLRCVLPKPQGVRTGDWEKKLSPQQIEYAACDAYSGIMVYRKIVEVGIKYRFETLCKSDEASSETDVSGKQEFYSDTKTDYETKLRWIHSQLKILAKRTISSSFIAVE